MLTAGLGVALTLTLPPDLTPPVWDRVAACESSHRWTINTGNGYYGGLQFSQTSWEGVGGLHMAPRADLATKAEQVEAARRLLALQGPGAWPACSVQAGLTRENGGPIAP